MKYAPPIGSTDPNAGYVDRTGNIPGSPVPAAAVEPPMREIENVIVKAGLTPNGADMEQLYQAIALLIQAGKLKGRPTQAGEYVTMSGLKLDPNCVWPDGSLVLFSDWPDLKTRFDAGYLMSTGAANRDAFPGYWITNASGTGLYLPKVGGLFARQWVPTQTEDGGRPAGSLQLGTAIRWGLGNAGNPNALVVSASGLPGRGPDKQLFESLSTSAANVVCLTSSYSTPGNTYTYPSVTTRPENYAQPVSIYLGRFKTEV